MNKLTFYSCIPSNPIATEAESRKWRLNLFNRVAKKYNYNFVLTGHTLNDEVETFIMQQFLRGFVQKEINTPVRNKNYLK